MKAVYYLQWRRPDGVGNYDREWNRVVQSDFDTEEEAEAALEWLRENCPGLCATFEHRVMQRLV